MLHMNMNRRNTLSEKLENNLNIYRVNVGLIKYNQEKNLGEY